MNRPRLKNLFIFFMMSLVGPFSPVKAQEAPPDSLVYRLLAAQPDLFGAALQNRDAWGIQVIYTQIDRNKRGRPVFTDHHFNTDTGKYFYPASTVKLPVAILALQRLNELGIPGLDLNSTLITGAESPNQTEVCNDPSAPDGRPTIAHYIKKILLVSDNDAFNRLYEFLGQEYINQTLHRLGYTGTQIIHRLSISLPEPENRHTNPVRFYDTTGRLLYEQPGQKSRMVYASHQTRMGKGYLQANRLVPEPFDFSMKNRMPLADLHRMLRSIIFPESVPRDQRFNLTAADYNFLRRYMSMRPGESVSPVYQPDRYWDNYVKMIFYGAEKSPPEEQLRIFNKTGTAYGFLVDACYIADFRNNLEFLCSAVIYCNSDGIFNDDQYDYHQTGYPFLKELGRVLYNHERQRSRKYLPDLSAFRYTYTP